MKNRYIKSILIGLPLTMTMACSDSFLESTPVMSETESTFYKNDGQLFKALVAAYDPLQHIADQALSTGFCIGEIRSDNARTGGGSEQDQWQMQDIESHTNTSVNPISEARWKVLYRGIYRCNLVIHSALSSEASELYKAEAKFLRAWYHFDILRTFGPGFISTKSSYPSDFNFTRNTREEMNIQIEKDLLEAIPVLKETFDATMTGRIRKTAAQALLAKVYMYWADWNDDSEAIFDQAIPLLEEVMNSGEYQLLNDYTKLFGPYCENNSESIFEMQRCTNAGWNNWGNKEGSEGSFSARFLGPRSLTNPTIYRDGYGFLLPTKDLYDYFLEDDSIRRESTVLTYDELVTEPNKLITDESKKVKWHLPSYGPDFEGYAQQKYAMFMSYQITGDINLNQMGNERLIRYGEVYLLLAEAYLRGSKKDEQKAKDLMNTLRQAHVASGNADYNTVDDLMAMYPERFPQVIDVLWYERRCELAGEGDRWFDLVRTGRAEQVMTTYLSKVYPLDGGWKKTMNYLPIGSIEISNSGNTLTEYPDEAMN